MNATTKPGYYECPPTVWETVDDDLGPYDPPPPPYDGRIARERHEWDEGFKDAEFELELCLHEFAMAADKDLGRARKNLDAARAEVAKFRKLDANGR